MSSAAVRKTSPGVAGPDPAFSIRPLSTHEDFAACVALQRTTWGEEFRDVVQASLLMVAQKVGGVAAGAFGLDGTLWGFVFGLTGIEAGRSVHWSHMLAVRPDVRDRGVGRRLKEYQRAWLRERQVSRVYWTFDPLVARNAHLNLNRLGVEVVDFIPNMYGPETGSPLHAGLGTDRLVVVWQLDAVLGVAVSTAGATPRGRGARAYDAARTSSSEEPSPLAAGASRTAAVGDESRIEIPLDIQALKEADPISAIEWRNSVRDAFSLHLAGGWRVVRLDRDIGSGRCAYVLARSVGGREAEVEQQGSADAR